LIGCIEIVPVHITVTLDKVARKIDINPLSPELNPICYLLALLGAHHLLHVSRIRVKLLSFRLLMSYIYIYIYIGFGGLEVACWPLALKFAGSNPAEAVGFLRAKKSSARLPSEGK